MDTHWGADTKSMQVEIKQSGADEVAAQTNGKRQGRERIGESGRRLEQIVEGTEMNNERGRFDGLALVQ
jgi:hypothetical protein